VIKSAYFTLQDWMALFEAENKQPNITVKECHDIIKRLNFKTFESRHKVMLIWLPEYLGAEGNTLLKILEEPPDNTIFLLVAENQDAVLNTILSRTQLIKINSIETDKLSEYLVSNNGVDALEAKNVSVLAQGDYIEAQKLLTHESGNSALLFMQWLEMCLNPGVAANHETLQPLLKWIEQFHAIGRENQKNVFRYGLHFAELLFRFKINGDISLLNEQELAMMKRVDTKTDFRSFEKTYALLNNGHYYLERNASAKILMLTLTLKLTKLFSNIDVDVKELSFQ